MARYLAATRSVTLALYGTAIMVASLLAVTGNSPWFLVVALLGIVLVQSAVCTTCRGNS